MIKTTEVLIDELKEYRYPLDKIARMIKEEQLVRITKGIYETDSNVANYLLASSIYGPSYISFEYALAFHGLIPESVLTVTCATFEKKKKKQYSTPVGNYIYRDVPSKIFYRGIDIKYEGDYSYFMAVAEKALCDQLYKMKTVRNYRELEELLFQDLRINEQGLRGLDIKIIEEYASGYGSVNVKRLARYLRRKS